MFRKENGVTLVALVITIIVLLILAGVTLSMVLGEGGIVGQAEGASLEQVKAEIQDHVNLALTNERLEDVRYSAGVDSTDPAKDTNIAERVVAYLTATYKDVYTSTNAVANEDGDVVTITKVVNGEDYNYTVDITTANKNYSATITYAAK